MVAEKGICSRMRGQKGRYYFFIAAATLFVVVGYRSSPKNDKLLPTEPRDPLVYPQFNDVDDNRESERTFEDTPVHQAKPDPALGEQQHAEGIRYEPNWESLDSRPVPKWWEDAKYGIFMHWGLYSATVTGAGMWEEWKTFKWKNITDYMKKNFKPGFQYADFTNSFTAELFNATKFAMIVKNSGARYYVLTSKHHEGYTMWKSNSSWNWNAVDTGPHRDLVGELAQSFRQHAPGVKFGLYFSQYDWFNPMYMQDAANKYTTRYYPQALDSTAGPFLDSSDLGFQTVQTPQLHDIVNRFKPEVLWSDGDWDAPDTYWKSQEFLAWLYNDSPVKDTVVSNDRWGSGVMCHHGGFYTCSDRYNPGVLQKHKWENCMTVDGEAWGFRRTATLKDMLTFADLVKQLVSTVSCNGNLLMNVGPTHDGRIIPIFEERLKQMGDWLRVNGEAIYGTKPWIYQNDTLNSDVWYTSKIKGSESYPKDRAFNPQVEDKTTVYATFLKWPEDGILRLGSPKPTPKTTIEFLGYPAENSRAQLKHSMSTSFDIDLRPLKWWKLPSTTAWVLRIRMLDSDKFEPNAL